MGLTAAQSLLLVSHALTVSIQVCVIAVHGYFLFQICTNYWAFALSSTIAAGIWVGDHLGVVSSSENFIVLLYLKDSLRFELGAEATYWFETPTAGS